MGQTEILSDNENKNLNEEMEHRMPKNRNASALKEEIVEEKEDMKNTQPETETKRLTESNMEMDKPLPNGTLITYQYEFAGKKKEDIYIVLQEISAGGFGRTYLCKRGSKVDDGTRVVIKEFCPKPKETYRRVNNELDINYTVNKKTFEDFLKEPQRINDLKNEAAKKNPKFPKKEWEKLNLAIPLTNAFECFNNWYYVMEYIEGKSLTEYLPNNYNNLSLDKRLQIVLQICIAIQNLHSKNCVHQDLSPNNVMIHEQENETFQVKVIDYGMSTSLFHTNNNISYVREGGSCGFSDVTLQYGNYKTLWETNDKERIKLIDIYSLGNILIYTCLASYELITSEWKYDFLKPVLDEKIITENTPIAIKEEFIKSMIKKLAKDAINHDLNERANSFGYNDYDLPSDNKTKFIDNFINRLNNIINELNIPIIKYHNENDKLEENDNAERQDINNEEEGVNLKEKNTKLGGYNNISEKENDISPSIWHKFKIVFDYLRQKNVFYRWLALSCFVLFAAIAFWIYKTSPEFFYTFPKQEQTSKDKPVTPEANFNESKTEKTLENKGQQTEKQHAQTGNKEKTSDKQPIEALDKTHKEHNYSAINVSDLTPARLTTIMGKAQTDATTRELLFNSFANNIIFMEIDENGNAFELSLLKLYNNLKDNAYQIGKTYQVDNFENENGKIKIVILTKIK